MEFAMNNREEHSPEHPRLKQYITGLAIIWTAVVIGWLLWSIGKEKSHTIDMARIQAKIAYEKDLIYRRWNAMHGGVYAPVTEDTQPSPYMADIPERDITTKSNNILTLINPDYMFRQAHEMAFEDSTVIGHMTSLKPTTEETVPDPWETEALTAFERGETEVSSVQMMEGKEYMRLMLPLYTEEGCLQCHAGQVSKVGDIRGGLSVAVPLRPLKAIESNRLVKFSTGIALLWLLGAVGIVLTGRRMLRSDRQRRRAEEQLIRQHAELQAANSELEVLNRVSIAVSQTIDLKELLNIVLETITGLELLRVEHKGGIFIIVGGSMELVSHLGHQEDFLEFHKDIRVGDCLCGLAAKTGEIIISKNSEEDGRHSIRYTTMTPHGHIVIPLKSMNKVVGVLYLYLPADTDIKKHKIDLLQSIGNQIGIAIENSRLYEETKELSLRDPLTGLANRRFMDIEFKRSFTRAKRLKRSLSTIMLDIDYFKKFNDTYGHTEGDRILVEVANILIKETREIDLAARYGGEEFLILLPETDINKASDVAERIRKAVETETNVTISMGVASFHDEMQNENELIEKADGALYQAKNKGRDRVEVCV